VIGQSQEIVLNIAATIPDATESAALLQRCAAGDRAALRLLYDLWSARLHGIALRITRQPALAADATHDTFVQVWQQAHRFDPVRSSANSFLVSLVRYRALDIVRRRSREALGHEAEDREDESPDPLAQMVSTAETAALQRCLALLNPERHACCCSPSSTDCRTANSRSGFEFRSGREIHHTSQLAVAT
jgi:RNA polymerase sigma-70 factor (ECF subfamily)